MDKDKDLFDGMYLFYAVVEQQGLSAAARVLGHTPSHVSKELARLETRLGARLLNRTTRKISLTEPGQTYFENARRIIEETRSIEGRLHAIGDRPYGELRMSVPVVFAHGCLNHWLPEFLERYPDVTLNIDVSERRADMIADGIDLLVRIGALRPSDFITRELFKTERLTVAAPSYLERKGLPTHPSDLTNHDLIDFTAHGASKSWTYPGQNSETINVPIAPKVRCNDAQTEKALALGGLGITRLPELACQREISRGFLVPILEEYSSPPAGVNVIYASRSNLPAKTRAMIDFLAEKSGKYSRDGA
ncbi:D-malate degradation protein R [Ruegeria sp. THAF57]|uniref:LysR family transcriptional regulator n=1 Tax=Ruegeria sp. THAF57 TaxID=2744555 RepID=UPI001771C0BD|nr:LysR family transcriptional regulator [Ruegeria sp. THAF57]CAD0184679.1 D-malate degradation protein R [Ruegeria sp. THAF57]